MKKEDIEFLKKLQHEMNTQDHVCQADPRFWVVQGTVREYGIESGYSDGTELCNVDGDVVAETMEKACEFLNERNARNSGNLEDKFRYADELDSIDYIDDCGDERSLRDFEDVLNFLDNPDYRVAYYRNIDKNYPDTMFITNAECKAHIKANYYHYPDDAHSYAMTAWRSPEVERLWKILQATNWDELNLEEGYHE